MVLVVACVARPEDILLGTASTVIDTAIFSTGEESLMFLLRLLRIANAARLRGVPVLPSVIGRVSRLIYHCEVSYMADIHPSTRFPHKALGVVVGDAVVVREGCTILHNVTLGGRGGPGMPTVESDVLIGAGACVLGPVTVGRGAIIGANAVVVASVPAGATVVGIPAQPIGRSRQ